MKTCPLPHCATHVDISWLDYRRWSIVCIFFSSLSLLTTKVHNYSLFACCLLGSGMDCQTQVPWIWKTRHIQATWVLIDFFSFKFHPTTLNWLWIWLHNLFYFVFYVFIIVLWPELQIWQVNLCWLGSIKYIFVSFYFKKDIVSNLFSQTKFLLVVRVIF